MENENSPELVTLKIFEGVRRTLKTRASAEGSGLSEYATQVIHRGLHAIDLPSDRKGFLSIEAKRLGASPEACLTEAVDHWLERLSASRAVGDSSVDGTRLVPVRAGVPFTEKSSPTSLLRPSDNASFQNATDVESTWVNKLLAVLRSGHRVATVAIQKNLEAFELLAVGGDELSAGNARGDGGASPTQRTANLDRGAKQLQRDTDAINGNARAARPDPGRNRKRAG